MITTVQQAMNSSSVAVATKITFKSPVSAVSRLAEAAVPNSAATEIAVARNNATTPVTAHRRPRSTASSEFRNTDSGVSAIQLLLLSSQMPAKRREAVAQTRLRRAQRDLKN